VVEVVVEALPHPDNIQVDAYAQRSPPLRG
jgi:hypothetical protein